MQVSDSGSVRLLDSSLQILIPSDDPAVSSSVVQILIKSTQLGVLYNVGLTVFSSKVKNSSKSETKNQKIKARRVKTFDEKIKPKINLKRD